MRSLLAACALLLAAAAPARAQDADPLKSPACGAAIASLQAARAGNEAAARVESLRSAAANTCLGFGNAPSRPARVVQAPIAVPPPQIGVTPALPAVPMPSLPPPPVAVDRLPVPAMCDAGGCWTNDGTHLRHVPPNLMGPGGLCSQLGGMVYCP